MPDPPVAEPALHQFLQPGLLEERTPATISFPSPKLTRKIVAAGVPPEATLRGHRPW